MATPLDTARLQAQLAKRTMAAAENLRARHPKAAAFWKRTGIDPGKLRRHATSLLAAGALTGSLLLSGSANATPKSPALSSISPVALRDKFALSLKGILPDAVGPLSPEQEQRISDLIQKQLGIHAVGELEGNHLNQTYGLIGAEQHLPRYPGDDIGQHGGYLGSGITPGRGAWGYFAPSREQLTQDLVEKEKYYVAVQTLYLPDWQTRLPYLRDWYKYRKVVVVNPVNGKAVVADVADSGPSNWTGKHFGGSPEIMAYLGLNVGMQKGPVVLFFVDDPGNAIPLGPVEYNGNEGPAFLAAT